MDMLIIIGIALAVVTTLSAIVYEMAEARGRHAWAWTLAALAGIAAFAVGWAIVAAALVLAGPNQAGAPDGQRKAAAANAR